MNRSTPLIHSEPAANDAGIARSFESPDWYLKGFAANIRVRAETVAAVVPAGPAGRILDIGCGDGSLSLPLLGRAEQITFLDRSKAMLDRVAAQVSPGAGSKVAYVNAGFMDADLGDAQFDLILCVGVLAYVQDVNAFLARVCAVLRPGGTLILECTHGGHFISRLERAYQALTGWLKPKPFDAFTYQPAQVVTAAEAQRLRLERTYRYAYSVPVLTRFLRAASAYRWIRRVYGDIDRNRRPALGNQCIFVFRSPPA